MNIEQQADIITNDHRLKARVNIIGIDDANNKLYTEIPRSLSGTPIPFNQQDVYNLTYANAYEIHFLKIRYNKLTDYNNKPTSQFEILEHNQIINSRKEERRMVEYQAVVSDFTHIGVVTIIDLSTSGMKIESDYEITSEFLEIFFDDENEQKRSTGRICWSRQEGGLYIYGVNLTTLF